MKVEAKIKLLIEHKQGIPALHMQEVNARVLLRRTQDAVLLPEKEIEQPYICTIDTDANPREKKHRRRLRKITSRLWQKIPAFPTTIGGLVPAERLPLSREATCQVQGESHCCRLRKKTSMFGETSRYLRFAGRGRWMLDFSQQ